ncbi:hypothetical protein KI387_017570, partial [Taxus chinensis]
MSQLSPPPSAPLLAGPCAGSRLLPVTDPPAVVAPPGISGSGMSRLCALHMADSKPRYHQGCPDNTRPPLSPPYSGPVPPWLLGLVPRLLIVVAPVLPVHPIPVPMPVLAEEPVPVVVPVTVPVPVVVPGLTAPVAPQFVHAQ